MGDDFPKLEMVGGDKALKLLELVLDALRLLMRHPQRAPSMLCAEGLLSRGQGSSALPTLWKQQEGAPLAPQALKRKTTASKRRVRVPVNMFNVWGVMLGGAKFMAHNPSTLKFSILLAALQIYTEPLKNHAYGNLLCGLEPFCVT